MLSLIVAFLGNTHVVYGQGNPCQPPIPPTIYPSITLCAEEVPYSLPWGDLATSSGVYSVTFTSVNGCDSVVRQNIIVKPPIVRNLGTFSSCTSDCVTVCGETFCYEGTYSVVCSSYLGCDSLVNFTLYPTGVPRGGVVYDDLNGNGQRDLNESFLSGVAVHTSSGQVQVTNAQGKYSFPALNFYDTLFIPNPPNNSPGTIPAQFFWNPNPSVNGCIDFGVLPPDASATGLVFMDMNTNGIFDFNDMKLNQVGVTATGQTQRLTGITGEYSFNGLQQGDTIRVVLPANASASTPAFYSYDTSQLYHYDFALTPGNSPANGYVFLDYNMNGVKNAGEPNIPGISVYTSSGAMTTTNASGNYTLSSVPNGDTIRVVVPGPPSVSIPDFRVFSFGNTNSVNFGITPSVPKHDLSVTLGFTGVFRPGFSNNLFVTVQNKIIPVQNASLRLLLPGFLEVQNISLPPTSMLGDTLFWSLNTLNANESITFSIKVKTPVGTPLGTNVVCRAEVMPLQNDLNAGNNTYTLNSTVVGSYDPNDKRVQPAYMTPEMSEQRPTLEYTVRFQNTGNFPADFVIIRDTLSNDLDLSSFRLLASSHPCTWEILPGKVLEVTFNNINLPDSISDEPGSHGFVHFSIRPTNAFPVGHAINNHADIYFDYNEPIRTNDALSQVVYFLPGGSLPPETNAISVRPNPAAWRLYVSWKTPAPLGSRMRLFDVWGLPVQEQDVAVGSTYAELNVSYLQTGLYLLVYETPDEVQRKQVVVARSGPGRKDFGRM